MTAPRRPLLFELAPALPDAVAWVALGQFPTPVARLARLGAAIGCPELWIKRDDLTGAAHGGNKVRKLEFLLAGVRARGARRVFIYGAAGSNWVVAALHYAKALGLARDVMLVQSPMHAHAEQNVAATRTLADTLLLRPSWSWLLYDLVRAWWRPDTCVLPRGGTNPQSTLGYVNAALELAAQVRAGELPEPECVYVPLGTCGTAAGLLAGLHLAGLHTRVVAVRITSALVANAPRTWLLAARTLALIARTGVSMAPMEKGALEVDSRHLGAGYALPTPAGDEATRLMADTEGIALDPSYTAKTVAALVDAVRRHGLGGRRVLYWLTLNSAPLPAAAAGPEAGAATSSL